MPPTKPRTIADLPTRHYVEDGVDMGKSLIKREDVQDLLHASIRELDEEIDTLDKEMKECSKCYKEYKTEEEYMCQACLGHAVELYRINGARDFAVKLLAPSGKQER